MATFAIPPGALAKIRAERTSLAQPEVIQMTVPACLLNRGAPRENLVTVASTYYPEEQEAMAPFARTHRELREAGRVEEAALVRAEVKLLHALKAEFVGAVLRDP